MPIRSRVLRQYSAKNKDFKAKHRSTPASSKNYSHRRVRQHVPHGLGRRLAALEPQPCRWRLRNRAKRTRQILFTCEPPNRIRQNSPQRLLYRFHSRQNAGGSNRQTRRRARNCGVVGGAKRGMATRTRSSRAAHITTDSPFPREPGTAVRLSSNGGPDSPRLL